MSVVEPPGGLEPERLEQSQRRELLDALVAWVDRHPEPDRPVFGFAGREFVSPRGLVRAIRSESEVGRQFIHSVELVLTEIPFETYIKSIERSGRTRMLRLRLLLMLWRRLFARKDERPTLPMS
jgi:hypothetical protein